METLSPNVVKLDAEGKVTLPERVLRQGHLSTGDLLFIAELSDDTLILKRIEPNKSAIEVLEEMGRALHAAGYDTTEKVDRLIDEIKREVTAEWLTKMTRERAVSS